MAFRIPLQKTLQRGFGHPVLFACTVVLTPLLWVLFVASSNPHELIVGLVVSIATLVFTVYVCHSSSLALTLRPEDVAQIRGIPGQIFGGIWEVVLVGCKDYLGIEPAESSYRVTGFDTSSHDPVRQARTVLAVAYMTTSPNFIVIGVDPAQSRMLFHQIHSTPVPKMVKALGAKA